MLDFLTGGVVSLLAESVKQLFDYIKTKNDKNYNILAHEANLKQELLAKREEAEVERYKTIQNTYSSDNDKMHGLNAIVRPLWGLVCLILFTTLTVVSIYVYCIYLRNVNSSVIMLNFIVDRIDFFEETCNAIIAFFFVKRSFQR